MSTKNYPPHDYYYKSLNFYIFPIQCLFNYGQLQTMTAKGFWFLSLEILKSVLIQIVAIH